MKKFLAVILTALTLVIGSIAFAACGGNNSESVQSIAMKSLPNKTVYIKDEAFDVTGGEILVKYTDGNEETVALTAEMCGQADTSSCGEKTLTVTYSYNETDFETTFSYTVIFSVASDAFLKTVNALPALNTVTTDHAEAVIAALEEWDALTEADRAYLNESSPRAYEKVNGLQERLLPQYAAAAAFRVEEAFSLLNAGKYTAENWAKIAEIVRAFKEGKYSSLKAVITAEEKAYADIEAVEKKTDDESMTVEEYRDLTAATLQQNLKAILYIVNGSEGTVGTSEKDYAQEETYRARVEEILSPILSAESIAAVDEAYPAAATAIRALYLEAFAKDAETNLQSTVPAWRSLIEETIALWDKEEISLRGQFENLPLDYELDGRWWIPEPYSFLTMLKYVPEKLASAKTVAEINGYYETFAYEILRSVMQRNLELSYVIERNIDSTYDTNDVLYWNNIADYWGSEGGNQAFVYNGIMDEYVGQTYGISTAHYRFAAKLYRDGGPEDIQGLVQAYGQIVKALHPEPKRVTSVEISVEPKTQYEAGETFSVEGGKILVSYNDETEQEIDMTDEMYDAASVDMTPNGTYELILHFTVNEEEQSVTLEYSVAQKVIESARVTVQPTNTTYFIDETVSVAGGRILVTFNDGSTQTVTMTDEMFSSEEADTSAEGRKELTLTFTAENDEEGTVTIVYTVLTPEAKRVSEAVITTNPKNVYEIGETFTVAGGVITVTYSDESEETVDMTDEMYAAADVDLTTAGEKEVTLTFTVNEENVTVKLTYTVNENTTLTALLQKTGELPAASEATAENIEKVEECLALYSELDEGAAQVFESKYESNYTKLLAVQKALVSAYVGDRAETRKDVYDWLNRCNYAEGTIEQIDGAYAALTVALIGAETFAEVDKAFEDYDAVLEVAEEQSSTVEEYAEASARTAQSLAEKVCVGQLYEISSTGANMSIQLKNVSFKESEGVAAAIASFKAALKEAETLDAAREIYEARIRTLLNTVWLEDYRAAAEVNVKAVVTAMRDSVKYVWGDDGRAENYSFTSTGFNYEVSLDYSANLAGYLWWTPDAFKVSVVLEKITVAAGNTKEEVFANYEASYFEMIRSVMYRNLHTVFAYNSTYHVGEYTGNQWQDIHSYYGNSDSAPEYDGTIEEFKGVPVITSGDYRLWCWGWGPDQKVTSLSDLLWHYNADMDRLLTEAQKNNGETV